MNDSIQLKLVLQKERLRYTQQRQAVWDELCSTDDHRDAEEIYIKLREKGMNVSRATVYRTIDVLEKNNLVRKLELGDGRCRFEHKISTRHHDHIICVNCGQIVEFVDDRIEDLQQDIATQTGFELVRHVHQLFGICANCHRS